MSGWERKDEGKRKLTERGRRSERRWVESETEGECSVMIVIS